MRGRVLLQLLHGPAPRRTMGPSLRNVVPPTTTGMVVLDVVEDCIRYVEVLHRDDGRTALAGLIRGRAP